MGERGGLVREGGSGGGCVKTIDFCKEIKIN